MLTQERLKELMSYCPDSGLFTRLIGRSGGGKAGDVTGSVNSHGYIVIYIDGRSYKAHRLAFLYMTGGIPSSDTDHTNGVKSDNSFNNLKSVTHAENGRNQKIRKNNASGVMGVSWSKRAGKWVSQIMAEGKVKHLGYFEDIDEAACARKSAELKHGFHINHGRRT